MRKLLVLAVVIIVVLIIGGAARVTVVQRASSNSDGPIFTSSYTLDSTKTDDLFVIADTVHLLTGSRVEADASMIGRSGVTIDGLVDGKLTVMSGSITMGKNAHINGDVSLIGNSITLAGQIDGNLKIVADSLSISPDSQLSGTADICAAHLIKDSNADIQLTVQKCGDNELAGWQSIRTGMFAAKPFPGGFSLAGFALTGILALGLAALSGLIVTIFPRRFGQMTQAIRGLPFRVARVGCLTQLLAVVVVGLLVVIIAILPPLGLVLLPILALLLLPLGLIWVIGWMTMALLTGDWLLRRFVQRTSPPMLTVIVGSLALFLIWPLLGILPFGAIAGSIIMLVTGAVGLGAAIMTRLGTRSPARSYFVQG